ncbi:unnamed protein product [Pleuronectes platessa]|uniref:Reverse transcriptase domain-containing protein n=1 Tax=Pleuronectes platessa TaxID=8262 RepID=A0A9N7VVJ5_PLEPL|nr:unnamed protein product [Pleuronectes platessa]
MEDASKHSHRERTTTAPKLLRSALQTSLGLYTVDYRVTQIAPSLLSRPLTSLWESLSDQGECGSVPSRLSQECHFQEENLDLSAAFDTVNHQILISSLQDLGVSSSALSLLSSYLNERTYRMAAQVLVQALVISHLDYCNFLLAGLPAGAIRPLQLIQNAANYSAPPLPSLVTSGCPHPFQNISTCVP